MSDCDCRDEWDYNTGPDDYYEVLRLGREKDELRALLVELRGWSQLEYQNNPNIDRRVDEALARIQPEVPDGA